ncbi:MAG: LuxR C-terminal-related transcriptional regulator, partial [candidate division Zixibacteria bacterium]|nr:LuxR C-terminal-related transcriptional regulator [candidate division Zixibacteria bacterium]
RVEDMVAPESRSLVRKHIAARHEGAYEHLAMKKDGSVIPVEVRGRTIPLEGRMVRVTAIRDLSERKRAEEELREAATKLESEHQALTAKHMALQEVLNHVEQEKFDFKHELSSNVEHALTPFVQKLRDSSGSISETDLELLEDTILSLAGSDLDVFAKNYDKLTPRERDICDRIRQGLSSKEIADDLSVTLQTVEKHRAAVRKKLQIKHKKVNLASYLRSR